MIGARGKPNLLLLTDWLGVGGAEIVIHDLATTVDRDRFNVSVCCLTALGPTGSELARRGIDISVLPNADPRRVDYFTAVQLRRVLRAKQIDVIHSHTTHALVDAAACRCLLRSVRVVHTFHFGNYPHHAVRTRLMEAVCCRVVDRLVAVGRVQRQRIKETYQLSDRAIGTVHNGVHFPPTSVSADPNFRRRVGAEGKILVGTIAHLCPQKGLYDLLAVARRVRDQRADVRFVVVGDGDLRKDLERQRAELGLNDTVVFVGLIEHAASRALPEFDIYFHPSLWEAMSMSILEAMAAGKSVVATDVGETAHVIDEGVDGFLAKPHDVERMARTLLLLADTPRLRQATGEAAARKVSERLTVAHMTRAYEQLYLNVLGWDANAHAAG